MNDWDPNDAPGESSEGSPTSRPSRLGSVSIVLAVVGLIALVLWVPVTFTGVMGGGRSWGLPPFFLSIAWLFTAIGTLILALVLGVTAITGIDRSRGLEVFGIVITVLVLVAFLLLAILH
ncbi:MAG: hypothetical protein IPK67_16455 [Planctomycetes bacterium]|jgi:hypothetical protein|nr:hypothetical protein [Planctomycetota bacterium]